MTEQLVLAFLTATAPASALAAGFEEEGVPLEIVVKEGSPEALAREAASRAALGLGIGGDRDRLVVALAAFPGRPYLQAKVADARAMGHDAARLAARRPLRRPLTGAEGV